MLFCLICAGRIGHRKCSVVFVFIFFFELDAQYCWIIFEKKNQYRKYDCFLLL